MDVFLSLDVFLGLWSEPRTAPRREAWLCLVPHVRREDLAAYIAHAASERPGTDWTYRLAGAETCGIDAGLVPVNLPTHVDLEVTPLIGDTPQAPLRPRRRALAKLSSRDALTRFWIENEGVAAREAATASRPDIAAARRDNTPSPRPEQEGAAAAMTRAWDALPGPVAQPRPFSALYNAMMAGALDNVEPARLEGALDDLAARQRLALHGGRRYRARGPDVLHEAGAGVEHLLLPDGVADPEVTCLHSLLGLTLQLRNAGIGRIDGLRIRLRATAPDDSDDPSADPDTAELAIDVHLARHGQSSWFGRVFGSLSELDKPAPRIAADWDGDFARKVYVVRTFVPLSARRVEPGNPLFAPPPRKSGAVPGALALIRAQAPARPNADPRTDPLRLRPRLVLPATLKPYRRTAQAGTPADAVFRLSFGALWTEFAAALGDVPPAGGVPAWLTQGIAECRDTEGLPVTLELIGAYRFPWDGSATGEPTILVRRDRADTKPALQLLVPPPGYPAGADLVSATPRPEGTGGDALPAAGGTAVPAGTPPVPPAPTDRVDVWEFAPPSGAGAAWPGSTLAAWLGFVIAPGLPPDLASADFLGGLEIAARFDGDVGLEPAQSWNTITASVTVEYPTIDTSGPDDAALVRLYDLLNFNALNLRLTDGAGAQVHLNPHSELYPVCADSRVVDGCDLVHRQRFTFRLARPELEDSDAVRRRRLRVALPYDPAVHGPLRRLYARLEHTYGVELPPGGQETVGLTRMLEHRVALATDVAMPVLRTWQQKMGGQPAPASGDETAQPLLRIALRAGAPPRLILQFARPLLADDVPRTEWAEAQDAAWRAMAEMAAASALAIRLEGWGFSLAAALEKRERERRDGFGIDGALVRRGEARVADTGPLRAYARRWLDWLLGRTSLPPAGNGEIVLDLGEEAADLLRRSEIVSAELVVTRAVELQPPAAPLAVRRPDLPRMPAPQSGAGAGVDTTDQRCETLPADVVLFDASDGSGQLPGIGRIVEGWQAERRQRSGRLAWMDELDCFGLCTAGPPSSDDHVRRLSAVRLQALLSRQDGDATPLYACTPCAPDAKPSGPERPPAMPLGFRPLDPARTLLGPAAEPILRRLGAALNLAMEGEARIPAEAPGAAWRSHFDALQTLAGPAAGGSPGALVRLVSNIAALALPVTRTAGDLFSALAVDDSPARRAVLAEIEARLWGDAGLYDRLKAWMVTDLGTAMPDQLRSIASRKVIAAGREDADLFNPADLVLVPGTGGARHRVLLEELDDLRYDNAFKLARFGYEDFVAAVARRLRDGIPAPVPPEGHSNDPELELPGRRPAEAPIYLASAAMDRFQPWQRPPSWTIADLEPLRTVSEEALRRGRIERVSGTWPGPLTLAARPEGRAEAPGPAGVVSPLVTVTHVFAVSGNEEDDGGVQAFRFDTFALTFDAREPPASIAAARTDTRLAAALADMLAAPNPRAGLQALCGGLSPGPGLGDRLAQAVALAAEAAAPRPAPPDMENTAARIRIMLPAEGETGEPLLRTVLANATVPGMPEGMQVEAFLYLDQAARAAADGAAARNAYLLVNVTLPFWAASQPVVLRQYRNAGAHDAVFAPEFGLASPGSVPTRPVGETLERTVGEMPEVVLGDRDIGPTELAHHLIGRWAGAAWQYDQDLQVTVAQRQQLRFPTGSSTSGARWSFDRGRPFSVWTAAASAVPPPPQPGTPLFPEPYSRFLVDLQWQAPNNRQAFRLRGIPISLARTYQDRPRRQ
ncbi:hypothetical protein [Falsiroseomonas sp.]|uniref:hypothetical protein n=1 Tax=Falsiroseomonas sp. TaxID=2870721 RepID=UPI003F6F3284